MNIYGEVDPMLGNRTQFAFKNKRKYIANVKIANIAYRNQHIDTEILHNSKDHAIVLDNGKNIFKLDVESKKKHVVLLTR